MDTPHNHPDARRDDGFDDLLQAMQRHFDQETARPDVVLLTVDTSTLFDLFLDSLPADARQHYTCNACRSFVRRYGGLLAVGAEGEARSAVWPSPEGQTFSRGPLGDVVAYMRRIVTDSAAAGVRPFVSDGTLWGIPQTGVWSHFSVVPPAKFVHRSRTETAGQRAASLREAHGGLCRALAQYPLELLTHAHRVLADKALYRGDKYVDHVRWLMDLNPHAGNRVLTTRAAVLAPDGWCFPGSGMLGTLLDDLTRHHTLTEIQGNWLLKMDPSRYQRAQVAPRAGNVQAAERMFQDLGIAPALRRRYATLADLRCTEWAAPAFTGTGRVSTIDAPSGNVPRTGEPSESETTTQVFGHLLAATDRRRHSVAMPGEVPTSTMTWEKFRRTVLPEAVALEVKVPATDERFAALTTAVDPNAPPVVQWDAEGARNPVAWYYSGGGADAEMRRRVTAAGGKYDDVDIRASLLWNDRSDLDLHVCGPEGEIYFGCKRLGRGWLDVDMNVSGETDTPVENVAWPRGGAPRGRYTVNVHNYTPRTTTSPFELELQVAGQSHRYSGVAPGSRGWTTVCEFEYRGGIDLGGGAAPILIKVAAGIRDATPATASAGGTAPRANEWGLVLGSWAPVTAVVPSPNTWANLPTTAGQHLFFLLNGCKDSRAGRGRGLFVEHLRGDLRPVRSTLEAHFSVAEVEGADQAGIAAGLGYSDQRKWGLEIRATRRDGTVTVAKIDRWD